MDNFVPVPFQIVSDPRQLKAFTDPLRVRVLRLLSEREATNQQLAAAVGVSQARVLYHVRFLLETGLIRLVEERVRGGNVEKFYRATALLHGLRPEPGDVAAVSSAVFGAVLQDLAASEQRYPDAPVDWEVRRVRLTPERRNQFRDRLNALIAEYWGGPAGPVDGDADGEWFAFASLLYRSPLAVAPTDRSTEVPARPDGTMDRTADSDA